MKSFTSGVFCTATFFGLLLLTCWVGSVEYRLRHKEDRLPSVLVPMPAPRNEVIELHPAPLPYPSLDCPYPSSNFDV